MTDTNKIKFSSVNSKIQEYTERNLYQIMWQLNCFYAYYNNYKLVFMVNKCLLSLTKCIINTKT